MTNKNAVWESHKGLGQIAKIDNKAPWNFAYTHKGSKTVFVAGNLAEAKRQIEIHARRQKR